MLRLLGAGPWMRAPSRRLLVSAALMLLVVSGRPVTDCVRAANGAAGQGSTDSARGAKLPPIRHVFVLLLENQNAANTFSAGTPSAPYLARTLAAQGAFQPNNYGIGHASKGNKEAHDSGQAPKERTQLDCPLFA